MDAQENPAKLRNEGQPPGGASAHKFLGKEAGAALLTLAAALALWLFIAGSYHREAIRDISRNLETINSYKTDEITSWLDDQNREAVRLSRHPFLGEIVSEEVLKPGTRRAELVSWLKDHTAQKRYSNMAFLSVKGAVIAATPGYAAGIEKPFKEAFAQAAQKGKPQLTDLYLTSDSRLRMAMFSPVSAGGRGGKPLCVLAIKIDPQLRFYPLLKAAPLFFTTAETLLVRKEGENVLYLDELDYLSGSALKLNHPLSEERLPAAAALRGITGFFAGVDYRGVKVFSAIASVPGTNWAIITQVNRTDIIASVKRTEYLQLALILLAASLLYSVVYIILRARERAGRAIIREGERRLAALFSNLPGVAYRSVNPRNWTIEFLSEGSLGLTGYRPEELLTGSAPSFFELIIPEDRERVRKILQTLPAGNNRYELTYSLQCKNGTIKTVWEQGLWVKGPSGAFETLEGFISDITPLKRAEEALRESEARFRELFRTMEEGFAMHEIICDAGGRPVDYRFLDVNPAFERLTGLKREAIVGRTVLEVLPATEKVWIENYGRVALSGEPMHFTSSSAALGKWYEVSAFSPGKGKFAVSFFDVTNRKLAEIELERLNRELINKKQEMENFLYITTHDLRSPLVNIQGFSQNLERYIGELRETLAPADLPQEYRKRLDKLAGESIPGALKFVRESSFKMDSLITALLKVSRVGRVEMKPETIDMDKTLKKAVDSMHYQLEQAGGEVKIQSLPNCKADPVAVTHIFANLLDNAIKYRSERPLRVEITGEIKGAMARYTVADNGAGIPEKHLPRIWDIFYRSERSQKIKGEGIGLAMTKRLIEKNGGRIEAESEEGEGSVFRVELPAGETKNGL